MTRWTAHIHATMVPLYAGFLYTGAMTVLLGLMLPRVAALHHLKDSQSGALLMTQFATSACGALLVRRRFEKTLVRGYALMAAGAVLLMLVPQILAVAAIGIFGLGLGMAMTSTSMLMGRVFSDSRGIALAILNFCWSIGATVCPVIVARLPGRFSQSQLCVPVALLGATFAVIVWRVSVRGPLRDPVGLAGGRESRLPVIVLFAAIAFLYVGAESTIGGWMSTYAARAVSWDFAKSNLAAACFWAALLAGRGLAPLILLKVSEGRVYLLSIGGVGLGILLLVEAHSPLMLIAGACCAGLMLAPIFPLTISLFLERAAESTNAGWVFAVAGFGGAVLPWVTGVVSTITHSLRTGLLVSLAAAVGMLLLSLLVFLSPRGPGMEIARPTHSSA